MTTTSNPTPTAALRALLTETPDQSKLFACLCGTWRTSWHNSLYSAIGCAQRNFGVTAVEEIGVGVVWRKDT
jgi:hypothetical protein